MILSSGIDIECRQSIKQRYENESPRLSVVAKQMQIASELVSPVWCGAPDIRQRSLSGVAVGRQVVALPERADEHLTGCANPPLGGAFEHRHDGARSKQRLRDAE